MKIFEVNMNELRDLSGGGKLVNKFNFKNKEIKLVIVENEFNLNFELFENSNSIYFDSAKMDSFEFEYFNQNENGSHIDNMMNILRESDEEILNSIMEEINMEIKDLLNL